MPWTRQVMMKPSVKQAIETLQRELGLYQLSLWASDTNDVQAVFLASNEDVLKDAAQTLATQVP